jgi:hypothetical protein
VANLTKQIAALKTRVIESEKKRGGANDDTGSFAAMADAAGNEFGGRNSKKPKN